MCRTPSTQVTKQSKRLQTAYLSKVSKQNLSQSPRTSSIQKQNGQLTGNTMASAQIPQQMLHLPLLQVKVLSSTVDK